jgi:hypothetical protein
VVARGTVIEDYYKALPAGEVIGIEVKTDTSEHIAGVLSGADYWIVYLRNITKRTLYLVADNTADGYYQQTKLTSGDLIPIKDGKVCYDVLKGCYGYEDYIRYYNPHPHMRLLGNGDSLEAAAAAITDLYDGRRKLHMDLAGGLVVGLLSREQYPASRGRPGSGYCKIRQVQFSRACQEYRRCCLQYR